MICAFLSIPVLGDSIKILANDGMRVKENTFPLSLLVMKLLVRSKAGFIEFYINVMINTAAVGMTP